MRVLVSLVLAVIMAGGAMAGVLAGKAVAGGNGAPEVAGVSGVREIGLPSEWPLQDGQSTSPLDLPLGSKETASYDGGLSPARGASSLTGAPSQAREVVFAGETPTNSSIRSVTSPIGSFLESNLQLGPSTTSTSGSAQAVQASREVPSNVSTLLVPWGDVNLDGVVGFDDLLLVSRALGTKPSEVAFLLMDMNGDGVVDVSDMAIVAAHLGDRFP